VVLVHGGAASPDHRESWYGTAVVAAVCAHLLGQGYSCISITDRGNPHAGAALRAIGFEPTTKIADFQFGARQ
jgi:predicted GNAT family acetyltransferase